MHFVEKWGRGIELILSKEPNASFKVIADMFVSTFKRKDQLGEGLVEGLVETTQKLPKNYPKTTHEVFAIIAEHPAITRRELAERLGMSPDGAKYHLDKLRKGGYIRRVGGRKGGHWEI